MKTPLPPLETRPCKQCAAPVDDLNAFPGGICLACHERRFNAEVARNGGQLPRPDFTKAINVAPSVKRGTTTTPIKRSPASVGGYWYTLDAGTVVYLVRENAAWLFVTREPDPKRRISEDIFPVAKDAVRWD